LRSHRVKLSRANSLKPDPNKQSMQRVPLLERQGCRCRRYLVKPRLTQPKKRGEFRGTLGVLVGISGVGKSRRMSQIVARKLSKDESFKTRFPRQSVSL
jgi:putative ribosome biogenesis GTPase RsgA